MKSPWDVELLTAAVKQSGTTRGGLNENVCHRLQGFEPLVACGGAVGEGGHGT